MKLKKILGYLILSQVLCLIIFLVCSSHNGIEKILADGIGFVWLVCEGFTAFTIMTLCLIKLAFDWIEKY